MSYGQYVGFRTTKCIITGEPAMVFTGHVIAMTHSPPTGDGKTIHTPIAVVAGFKDQATLDSADRTVACFGEWKKEYGIEQNI